MTTTVFDVLNNKLADMQKQQEEFLASGGATDYPIYKESCGVIRGLAAARREIEDLAQNYMDAEDD
jgi:hypothetical protein